MTETLVEQGPDGGLARSGASPPAGSLWTGGLFAGALWLALAALVALWPNRRPWAFTEELAAAFALAALALAAAAVGPRLTGRRPARLERSGPWLIAAAVALAAWEVATAKLDLLPVPFFAPPQALVEVFTEDYLRLATSLLHSLALLATGYGVGAVVGFVTGVSIGWSRSVAYWVHPVLRLLGPLPPTALLPLTFFFLPTSWSAGVFLIALATWFPVTVLTASGVASVNRNLYDVARTLGADERFLVLKVAVPAALPQVFVGLFMGLGASFTVLVTAEMMGVKAGLGFYLQWAQGWASYANMYAALLVMAVTFSGIITLLFRARDRVLSWQKGIVKW